MLGAFRVFINPMQGLQSAEKGFSNWITRIIVFKGQLNLELTDFDTEPIDALRLQLLIDHLENKSLVFNDFSAKIKGKNLGVVNAKNIALQLDGSKNLERYEFAGFLESNEPMSISQLGQVQMTLESIGNYSTVDSAFNGRVDLLTSTLNTLMIEPISVDLTYKDKKLALRRIHDARPVDIAMILSEKEIQASGSLVGLVVSEFVQPVEGYQALHPWFDSIIDGEFNVTIKPKSNEFAYQS